MELRIDFDFEAATEYLDEVKDSVLDRVVTRSLNSALKAAEDVGKGVLKDKYSLKKTGTWRKGLPTANPGVAGVSAYRGLPKSANYVESLQAKVNAQVFAKERAARMNARTDSLSTIHFVVGDKKPRDQAGVAKSDRKPTYVRVRKGSKTRLRSKFIGRPVKVKGGVQVFRVGDYNGRENILLKDSLPNVHSVLTRDEISEEMIEAAQQAFNEIFDLFLSAELKRIENS